MVTAVLSANVKFGTYTKFCTAHFWFSASFSNAYNWLKLGHLDHPTKAGSHDNVEHCVAVEVV